MSSTVSAPRRGRPAKYPWEQIATRGITKRFPISDLDVSEGAFRSAASAYGSRHGLVAHVVKTKDGSALKVSFEARA